MTHRAATGLVLAAALCAGLGSARPLGAQALEKPRLDAGRVTGEVLAGTYAGIGGFLIGRATAVRIAEGVGAVEEPTLRRAGWAGGILGGGLATAGVVYGIGRLGETAGDFDATWLGSGAGFVLSATVARLLFGADGAPPEGMRPAARWATINALALLPAIGATIGFNSTRRIAAPPSAQ
ncbi:MAG: hypothetical protein FJ361_03775 [Gemmatimonadetes bacterium]|nr:hypothetical protein [Gemmatimonadota bacterium]